MGVHTAVGVSPVLFFDHFVRAMRFSVLATTRSVVDILSGGGGAMANWWYCPTGNYWSWVETDCR
jgi:hypothetical protein